MPLQVNLSSIISIKLLSRLNCFATPYSSTIILLFFFHLLSFQCFVCNRNIYSLHLDEADNIQHLNFIFIEFQSFKKAFDFCPDNWILCYLKWNHPQNVTKISIFQKACFEVNWTVQNWILTLMFDDRL